jgi:hypothetical protein
MRLGVLDGEVGASAQEHSCAVHVLRVRQKKKRMKSAGECWIVQHAPG